jgi:bifunctional non-homologous end joining protein LigD
VDGLIGLAQMSILEIHPWGSRGDRIDYPDRLFFDLDPDPDIPWQRVIDAAFLIRDLLAKKGLTTFLKTTGGKGLHVVVPLSPRRTAWPEAKQFAREIAEWFAGQSPQLFTSVMSKAQRRGKIFIDYLRNDRGATAIAPYSTRAKPGAPVSVPLAWNELSPDLRSDHFTLASVPDRLKSLRGDPWKGFFDIKQTIPSG